MDDVRELLLELTSYQESDDLARRLTVAIISDVAPDLAIAEALADAVAADED